MKYLLVNNTIWCHSYILLIMQQSNIIECPVFQYKCINCCDIWHMHSNMQIGLLIINAMDTGLQIIASIYFQRYNFQDILINLLLNTMSIYIYIYIGTCVCIYSFDNCILKLLNLLPQSNNNPINLVSVNN